MSIETPLPVAYDSVRDYVGIARTDAYVHIGDGTDDTLRYLSRIDGGDHLYAIVLEEEVATLFVSSTYLNEAHRRFPGDDVIEIKSDISSEIEGALERSSPTIRIPETTAVAHHRALSGFADVEVVDDPVVPRSRKNEAERKIITCIERGAQHAMTRAEAVLADAEVRGDELHWAGDQLTTDRLRCEIRKALAEWGLSDGSGAIIGAGSTCAELHFTGQDSIEPGETVLIDLGPRGPYGYHGDLTRTFVKGQPSSWTAEAHSIVREALEAAFKVLDKGAGIPAGDTYDAITEVIGAYGYETGDIDVGLTHGTGHGVGVSIHEPPFSRGDRTLEAGNVITIEPGLYDPERGGVRLEDLVLITEDGYENLVDYPYDMTPETRDSPW